MKSVKEYIYENEEKQGTYIGAFFILLVVFVLLWLYLFKPDNLWEKLATFAVLSYFLMSSTRKVKKEVTTTDEDDKAMVIRITPEVMSRFREILVPLMMMRGSHQSTFTAPDNLDDALNTLRDFGGRTADNVAHEPDTHEPNGDRHVGRFDNVLGDER